MPARGVECAPGGVPALPCGHWAHRHGRRMPAGGAPVRVGEAALAEAPSPAGEASARSVQWPLVPETNEQSDFVRSWTPRVFAPVPAGDPLLDPATLAAARWPAGALSWRDLAPGWRSAMRSPPPPSTSGRANSPPWATCWAAARSTCRGAPGAMTPPWRCVLRRACSSAGATMPRRRSRGTGAGNSTKPSLGRPATCVGIHGGYGPRAGILAMAPPAVLRVARPGFARPGEPVVRRPRGAVLLRQPGTPASSTPPEPARHLPGPGRADGVPRTGGGRCTRPCRAETKEAILARAVAVLEAPAAAGVIAASSGAALPAALEVSVPARGRLQVRGVAAATALAALAAALDAFARTDNLRDARC